MLVSSWVVDKIQRTKKIENQGQDSPTLKLCYLSFQLVTFLLKTVLEEKTVIAW